MHLNCKAKRCFAEPLGKFTTAGYGIWDMGYGIWEDLPLDVNEGGR